MSMLIPEAWDHDATMPEDIKGVSMNTTPRDEPWTARPR